MKVAVYGRKYNKEFKKFAQLFFNKLNESEFEVIIYEEFFNFLTKKSKLNLDIKKVFNKPLKSSDNIDIVFSIGGDGTFLECVSYVRNCGVPIVGINSGRLGFLANISKEEIDKAIDTIKEKRFNIVERSLISVSSDDVNFGKNNFGLNEITIQKRNTSSMITVDVHYDGEFLNSYWADGLIISTPTGSTAYSLSVGGPIVMPGSQNFIITPIAPHNLNVRPFVVPDNKKITVRVKSRSKNYMTSVDFKNYVLKTSAQLEIKIADFKIKTIFFNDNNFFDVLRNKLLWGLDKRN